MNRKIIYTTLIMAFIVLSSAPSYAQISIPDAMSQRYIRVAEVGQLTDTVNVWGDVNSEGRYIIPQGTRLPELVSFSLGFNSVRSREINSWSKTEIKLKVSRYNAEDKKVNVALFKYRYDQPEPARMFDFPLENNDIVTLQVRRKASFGDYLRVIAPTVGIIASSVLLFTRLN